MTQSEVFFSGALGRIRRSMFFLGGFGTAIVWGRFGGRAAIGFLLGAVVAYLNFHWLKRVVNALGERMTASESGTFFASRRRGMAARLLLRYLLVGLGAYAIFRISLASFYGFLAGLFLPVGAIFCEAVYELYAALRRGL